MAVAVLRGWFEELGGATTIHAICAGGSCTAPALSQRTHATCSFCLPPTTSHQRNAALAIKPPKVGWFFWLHIAVAPLLPKSFPKIRPSHVTLAVGELYTAVR